MAGTRQSGWHVTGRSPDMSEQTEDLLVSLIRSQLEPLNPLPNFPTPEELAEAEVRFYQFATPQGVAIFHTCESGRDALGRPNTYTHAVLLEEGDLGAAGATSATNAPNGAVRVPAWRSIDAWRAPFWLRPFGADAAREAVLPAEVDVLGNQQSAREFAAAWLAHPARVRVVAQIAAALEEQRQGAPAPGEASGAAGKVVLVGADSCDEAAGWLCALAYLCTAGASRAINFSTWERLRTPFQAEAIRRSGLDLAFVPRSEVHQAVGSDYAVVIDAQIDVEADPFAPAAPLQLTGTWGRLIDSALTAGNAAELAELVEDVFRGITEVEEAGGVQLASPLSWALAATEAGDFRLVTKGEAQLDERVDAILLATPPEVLESAALAQTLGARFAATSARSAAQWRAVLDGVATDCQVTAVNSMAFASYLQAVVQEEDYQEALAGANPRRADLGARWAARPGNAAALQDVIKAAARAPYEAYAEQGLDGPSTKALAAFFAFNWLAGEGAFAPAHPVTAALLRECVQTLLRAESCARILPRAGYVAAPVRRELLRLVEESLAARQALTLPALPAGLIGWLAEYEVHLPPLLAVERTAAQLLARDPGADVAALTLALRSLGRPWQLQPELDLALAASLRPGLLPGPVGWNVAGAPTTALAAAWACPAGQATDWLSALTASAPHCQHPGLARLAHLSTLIGALQTPAAQLCPDHSTLTTAGQVLEQVCAIAAAGIGTPAAIHQHLKPYVVQALRVYLLAAYSSWDVSQVLYLPGDDYVRLALAELLYSDQGRFVAPHVTPGMLPLHGGSFLLGALAAYTRAEQPARGEKLSKVGAEKVLSIPFVQAGYFDLRYAYANDYRFAKAMVELAVPMLRAALMACSPHQLDWIRAQVLAAVLPYFDSPESEVATKVAAVVDELSQDGSRGLLGIFGRG